MKFLIGIILVFVFFFSQNFSAKSLPERFSANSLSTSFQFQNSSQVYEGTIGALTRVVFELKNHAGEISGFYYYSTIGSDIKLKGSLVGNDLLLKEFDAVGKTKAIFKGKVINNKISGTWQDLKTKKILKFALQKSYEKIPPIPDMVGNYLNAEETHCKISCKIFKKGEAWFYDLRVADRHLKGIVTFQRELEDQMVYITFEGIEWESNPGPLDENMEPDPEYGYLPTGIQGVTEVNKIRIQNDGNAINSYHKLAGCEDRFIILERIK